MAQRNSSGRGGTATRTRRQAGNQTPNTPTISESEISRMRVDDIRAQLRRRGVAGISVLRKPELVKTLARTLRAEGRGAARRSTGPAGRASATRTRTTGGTRTAASARTRATPARAKAAPAPTRAKAAPGRAKAAPSPARARAAQGRARATASPTRTTVQGRARAKATPTRAAKPASASASARRTAPASARRTAPASARRTAPARKAAPARAGQGAARRSPIRTGRSSSRSARSSQPITSLQDRPERPGRSLVTTNHDVIRRWARERNARPATIAGTERNGRAGVLTFNLPGYRESSRMREITWDEWFRTFDGRRLNLIYQEQLRDGRQSNFFRTESPDREDG
ncbi:hypothetical protein [Micromonospora carbonacea]|uniref:Rho termination factor N-terminal domain-containing protein n=1 Tax=Micromonospora carbonacea TaxID=47853 RepID=A0A1C4U7J6_9ACTN|nr:hypothetical protein GA0070563_101315 [Micromonospora carbonacea]